MSVAHFMPDGRPACGRLTANRGVLGVERTTCKACQRTRLFRAHECEVANDERCGWCGTLDGHTSDCERRRRPRAADPRLEQLATWMTADPGVQAMATGVCDACDVPNIAVLLSLCPDEFGALHENASSMLEEMPTNTEPGFLSDRGMR